MIESSEAIFPLIPNFLRERPFIPLTTQRLTLRLPKEADADAFVSLFGDEEVRRYLRPLPRPCQLTDGFKDLTTAREAYQTGEALFLVIEHRETGQAMGTLELKKKGELGYALGKPFWQQGYGKEAIAAFVQFAFALLNVQEIQAETTPENAASQRLLSALGFACVRVGDKLNFTLSQEIFESARSALQPSQSLVFASALFLMGPDNRFLVAQIPPHKSFPGTWELPGGKLHAGETPEAALIREIEEELGVQIQSHHLRSLTFTSYPMPGKRVVVFFYLCKTWKGEPYGKEGQAIAWVHAKDLLDYPPPAPDLAAFHALASLVPLF
ncbi:MAG: bifunctional GNAT family N-acetyltransferase/(deoxy)nucleoside triphosphate pyrophosphohydrolase [Alphaproteobacteria bacterium]